uniref:Uncharacterized protein n=1 Tax=Arundo donax TaxID=35708 RepID=A0A0A9EA30_ARUDO
MPSISNMPYGNEIYTKPKSNDEKLEFPRNPKTTSVVKASGNLILIIQFDKFLRSPIIFKIFI